MAETMDEPMTIPSPAPAAPSAQSAGRNRRRWALPAGVLALGLAIGSATGAGITAGLVDPTKSTEYRALQEELRDSQAQIADAEKRAQNSQAAAQTVQAAAVARSAELDRREQTVAAREQAVSATEQTIARNSIGQGTWTVGVDVEPGTYRTKDPVLSQCYWGIYRTGSNGDDIIENDIVDGGFPTVRLSEGQDFKNNGCGTFVKQ